MKTQEWQTGGEDGKELILSLQDDGNDDGDDGERRRCEMKWPERRERGEAGSFEVGARLTGRRCSGCGRNTFCTPEGPIKHLLYCTRHHLFPASYLIDAD